MLTLCSLLHPLKVTMGQNARVQVFRHFHTFQAWKERLNRAYVLQ